MWHFCLVLDPLHLCAEREFDTSRGGYTPLKWPLGQARDEKKNLGPGPGLRLPTHISTSSLLDQHFQAALQGSGSGERPPPPHRRESKDRVIVPVMPLTGSVSSGEAWLMAGPRLSCAMGRLRISAFQLGTTIRNLRGGG